VTKIEWDMANIIHGAPGAVIIFACIQNKYNEFLLLEPVQQYLIIVTPTIYMYIAKLNLALCRPHACKIIINI
jgi:hypothetical protein